MDSRVVSSLLPEDGGGERKPAPTKTYTEIFYENFPFYLSIGMTADEYWNQDSCLTRYYAAAYELKRKRANEEAWMHGLYIYEALCAVSPVLHAFAKRGTKPAAYPDKPYPMTAKARETQEEIDRKARYDAKRAAFFAMAAAAKKKKSQKED